MEEKLCKWSASVRPRCVAIFVLASALWSCGTWARAGFISIDDFTQPGSAQFFVVPSGMNSTLELSQVVSGAIGGQRDILVHVNGQTAINSASGMVGHDSSFNLNALQLATNGLSPTSITLQYSGLNTQNTSTSLVNAHNLGGLDLTGGGTNDRLRFVFFSSDAQPTTGLDYQLMITGSNGTSTATGTISNSATGFNVDIPFTQLIGNATLNHIDSVSVTFNGIKLTPNIDFEISGITAVPEPATCLTMAIGGLLFSVIAGTRRHSRRP
jgi:hypothetical protein